MKLQELLSKIALGEDSTRQFKADVTNGEQLAAEMAAFANTNGGTIFIGVADNGTTPGLSTADVARINQLVSNAASQQVRSPLVVTTENVPLKNGRLVMVVTVPKGFDKPYFDKNGIIWLKAGADKRRINSKEELRRLILPMTVMVASSPRRFIASQSASLTLYRIRRRTCRGKQPTCREKCRGKPLACRGKSWHVSVTIQR